MKNTDKITTIPLTPLKRDVIKLIIDTSDAAIAGFILIWIAVFVILVFSGFVFFIKLIF